VLFVVAGDSLVLTRVISERKQIEEFEKGYMSRLNLYWACTTSDPTHHRDGWW